jgi:hypothetical protein
VYYPLSGEGEVKGNNCAFFHSKEFSEILSLIDQEKTEDEGPGISVGVIEGELTIFIE